MFGYSIKKIADFMWIYSKSYYVLMKRGIGSIADFMWIYSKNDYVLRKRGIGSLAKNSSIGMDKDIIMIQ